MILKDVLKLVVKVFDKIFDIIKLIFDKGRLNKIYLVVVLFNLI